MRNCGIVIEYYRAVLKKSELLLHAKHNTTLNKSQTRAHIAQFCLYKAPNQARLNNGDLRIGINFGKPVINWEGI